MGHLGTVMFIIDLIIALKFPVQRLWHKGLTLNDAKEDKNEYDRLLVFLQTSFDFMSKFKLVRSFHIISAHKKTFWMYPENISEDNDIHYHYFIITFCKFLIGIWHYL